MANYLKMAQEQLILKLKDRGWSNRRIGKELGICRGTVNRYVNKRKRQAESVSVQPENNREAAELDSDGIPQGNSKPATAPPGSKASGLGLGEILQVNSKPANAPPGSDAVEIAVPPGSTSRCVGYHEIIVSMLEQEFSAQRMHQDLVVEHNFNGSYYSVKRYVNKLRQVHILPFRRMECSPGMEAQVDFGTAAPVIMSNGKQKRSHAFRIVLSCSRKAYSECVFHQTTEAFLRCLENAFRHFGGVPQTLVIDNLRAAVSKADWYDPEVVPKFQSFCEHYGTAVLPAKPYTPRHKGKVESGVKYIKSNALKGKTFNSLNEQNEYLLHWERNIADKRIHGTTRRQVEKMFEETEKPALKALPADLFPSFEEAPRKVHRDGHVEIEKAYYSVPPEYTGRKVWARWDSRIVRIFDSKMQQIFMHSKTEPGLFQTDDKHIHDRKRYGLEKGVEWLINKTVMIGPSARRWAQNVIDVRGATGQRSVLGLLSLCKKHSRDEIDDACQKAVSCGAYRLKSVRKIIEQNLPAQQMMEFIDEHPIIRDMSNYQDFIDTRRTNQ